MSLTNHRTFETMPLFEALFQDMIEQGYGKNIILTVKAQKTSANIRSRSENLPILAQTNPDGNCFLIMLISMSFFALPGIQISWQQIVGIAFLILFLSVGAPNQLGSIMIGILIITL